MGDGVVIVIQPPGTIEVLYDGADCTVTRRWSNAGYADTTVAKPNTAGANAAQILANAQAALAANVNYLAIATPTTAQAVAQVGALTRQINGVIRTLLGAYDAVT